MSDRATPPPTPFQIVGDPGAEACTDGICLPQTTAAPEAAPPDAPQASTG